MAFRRVEWDPEKAALNRKKHGVSFAEAATVLGDPLSLTIRDVEFGEERLVTVGADSQGRVLVVVTAEQGDRLRIISARRATASERRRHEEEP